MNLIWSIFSLKEKKWIFWLICIVVISSLLELIGLVMVIPYINLMLDNAQDLSRNDTLILYENFLDWAYSLDKLTISILFVGFYIFKNLSLSILFFLEQNIIKDIKFNLTTRSFLYYLNQDFGFHLSNNSSKIVRSVTYDINIFMGSILKKGSMLLAELLIFVGVICFLAYTNPIILMVFSVFVIPVIGTYLLLKKKLIEWGRLIQIIESNVIKFLQESMGGIKSIKVFGAHNFFIDKFNSNIFKQVTIKRNLDMSLMLPRYVIESTVMVVFALLLLWVANTGGLMQNISLLAFLAVATIRIMPMSNRVLSALNGIRSSLPSISVVNEIARPAFKNLEVADNNVRSEHDPIESFLTLTVNNLFFGFSNKESILKNLNFKINHGESIGIVGLSGSGKTTLVDLLLGLHKPLKGDILCNDLSIFSDLRNWQNKIGYVPQDIFLLDATIKENIAYGISSKNVNLDKINKIIEEVKIKDWINQLDKGLDTFVGERGTRISGGQRQRIGIARALYNNPEILILDEATSSLDNMTEKKIMNDINAMKNTKTLIIVAHRLNTIKKCNKILLIENGRIVAIDTYDNLSRFNSTFQKIKGLQ
jgi:ATP-binding cassette, subfamily B, bacterial PglK